MRINFLFVNFLTLLFIQNSFSTIKEKWSPKYQTKIKQNKSSIENSSKKDQTPLLKKNPQKLPKNASLELLKAYSVDYKNKNDLIKLKKQTLGLKGKAIPSLVKVIKNSKFPDKNRWMAMFLLGRIMGKKASPYLARYLKHKNWVLRLAALKTLLALREKKYAKSYSEKLRDRSLIVRTQALTNIRELGLTYLSKEVWKMMYRKHNYKKIKGKLKRTGIIREIITTIGALRYTKVKSYLLTMIQKDKYKDLFKEINTSLASITGKTPPSGDMTSTKIYWSKYALKQKKL